MKGKKLLEKMTFLDDDLIENSDKISKRANKKSLQKWYTIAACLGLIIFTTAMLKNINNTKEVAEGKIGIDKNQSSIVEIPKIELPKENTNVQMDMAALVVYKGNIYIQSKLYEGDTLKLIDSLVGEKLGYAKGNIDEWSKQKEYAKEFAATITGDVYSVRGYSEDFRLCIVGNNIDENGEEKKYIEFYENTNGIGLNKGEDLFNNRLKIDNNWENVKYMEHENWDTGYPDYKYLDLTNITDEDINKFLDELNKSEFVDMTNTNIYETENHHLFLYLKDGTSVELRLMENGYVGYQPLGWYFVKMPGEIFNKIYEATK